MKFIFLLFLISSKGIAQNQNNLPFFFVDVERIQKRAEERKWLTVSGRVLAGDDTKGQLRLYVRSCGKIYVPKNSKSEIPKVGQMITATLKERCVIDDWK